MRRNIVYLLYNVHELWLIEARFLCEEHACGWKSPYIVHYVDISRLTKEMRHNTDVSIEGSFDTSMEGGKKKREQIQARVREVLPRVELEQSTFKTIQVRILA